MSTSIEPDGQVRVAGVMVVSLVRMGEGPRISRRHTVHLAEWMLDPCIVHIQMYIVHRVQTYNQNKLHVSRSIPSGECALGDGM